ncbi:16S rRNA (cytosine(1402)-N(4))-methyltransferase [Flavobacteriaceae bacterium UJ101]|nr:16S rRNA (cytosine(1402)-N(4))-methyltransferase [Flavobacteriaceae bacterium UJ101]
MSKYHVSVLLKESVDFLVHKEQGTYVDVTFGGGGHSREILTRLNEKGKLFSFDQDQDALDNRIEDDRFTLINQNFRFLKNSLRMYGVNEVEGVLADLGVSSHQFDTAERGFSTRFDGELDMRMNQMATKNAKTILNDYSEKELAEVFYYYGELKDSYRIAKKIMDYRVHSKINTTNDLKEIVLDEIPKFKQNKYLAQVFQALRIEVNDEMDALKEMLVQAADVLSPGGKLVVISYHSLEDRLVKRFIKKGLFKGQPEVDMYGRADIPLKQVNRKVILPTEEEIVQNNRARSAKLRVAEKNG